MIFRTLLPCLACFVVFSSIWDRTYSWSFFHHFCHFHSIHRSPLINWNRHHINRNSRIKVIHNFKLWKFCSSMHTTIISKLYNRQTSVVLFRILVITARNKEERVRFTTSVCPSVCGWHVVLNSSFVPYFQWVFQKWRRNFASNIILLGTPCKHTTFIKNKSTMFTASPVLCQAIKCDILENRSTTTKIESFPRCVLGSPKYKVYTNIHPWLLRVMAYKAHMHSPCLWSSCTKHVSQSPCEHSSTC